MPGGLKKGGMSLQSTRRAWRVAFFANVVFVIVLSIWLMSLPADSGVIP